MKCLLFILCLCASSDEEAVFLEMEVPRSSYHVQEPVPLVLRIGYDAQFFKDHAIQLFHRHLDVPVQLEAGWIENLPGTIPLETGSGGRISLVLNDSVVEAARTGQRGRYTVLEIERPFLPNSAGELVLPAPTLRYAHSTSFTEDLVTGRVPEDRHDVSVTCEPLALTILPLPEAGRPPEFFGAVGRFTVRARADTSALTLGESLRWTLEIEGKGNVAFFRTPRLEGLKGFHVYGHIDEKSRGRRTITYDMAPLSEEVTEIPSIPFTFFDPGPPAGYRTVRSQPVPLEVKPLPEGVQLTLLTEYGRAVPGVNDLFGLKPVPAVLPEKTSSLFTAVAFFSPWLLAFGLVQWLRKRERDRIDPLGVRARKAAARFREEAGKDPAQPFAAYLAARLRCPDAAVISPDLSTRLSSEGVPADLSQRAAALLDRLVSNRYGSERPGTVEEAAVLVDALESAFLSMEEAS